VTSHFILVDLRKIELINVMDLLKFCKDLYRIPRSLTGKGVVESLEYIKKYIPLEIKNVKSGSQAFDWIVPPEWNIKQAYILNLTTNEKIVDFNDHNLHIVGYSEPVDLELNYEELINKIYYKESQPDAIPYVTSYYSKTWGFCMSYNQFKRLDRSANYKVFIDSDFNDEGVLTYGELFIKGQVKEEIFFSSYICHPQMVNNELSGPAVLTSISEFLIKKSNYYSYRFILVPETIGSIVYLSKNLDHLKSHVIGGFNITCVGDERGWGLIPSRYGNNISDKIAEHVLNFNCSSFIKYSWLDRGSDERQYCAPGVDLPISSITRSKYAEYPEYHTSLDNFDLVTEKGLSESLDVYLKCIDIFERNRYKNPSIKVYCEPQLGKRELYPKISDDNTFNVVQNMMNFISYCDGKNSILEIANICSISFDEAFKYYKKMEKADLFEK